MERKVCDGCWKQGKCDRLYCKCSCSDPQGPGWIHADNPAVQEVYELEEGVEY